MTVVKTLYCAEGFPGRSRDRNYEVDAKKYKSFGNVSNFKYLGMTVIENRFKTLKLRADYILRMLVHSVQNISSYHLLSQNT
jgi:hypothetical protein